MDTLALLQIAWFFLIGILMVGYSILDGFDLGVGILFPFIAREEREREILLHTIGPVWDGNEVWLLTAGGALFAAFPIAYATVFSGMYLALMLLLFALIFRAVSLEFWKHDPSRRPLWTAAFSAGSFLPSLLFGVALGNVVTGVPLTQGQEFAGTFFSLLGPFPLLTGLLGLLAIIIQGAAYTLLKTAGQLRIRAGVVARKMTPLFIIVFLTSFISALVYNQSIKGNPAVWLFCFVVPVISVVMLRAMSRGRDGLAFLLSSLNFSVLWVITGFMLFPNLVRASNNPDYSITIYNSSSGPFTLKVMLIIALIGMPVVLAYTAYIYKIFRERFE